MTDSQHNSMTPGIGTGARPEELPPVTPPSAGYIIQLFLIPALIVAAVVAVWALFGKLADSENDWKQMVTELGSSNEHRRWRAALGLAQLLRNDSLAPVEGEVPLAEQPIIIDGLVTLLKTSLDAHPSGEKETAENIKHQEFLTRTLSSLNADDKVLPILARAMSPEFDPEVRKSALMSVGAIAGRHFEAATGYDPENPESDVSLSAAKLPLESPTISDAAVWTQLRSAAQDPDPVIRHLAGFTLGSISGPDAMEQLRVMLLDADPKAQANAAIGLARNGSTEGIDTVIRLLDEATVPFDMKTVADQSPEDQRAAIARHEVEQPILVRNCIRAIVDRWSSLNAADQQQLSELLTKLSTDYFAADVRNSAKAALQKTKPGQEL